MSFSIWALVIGTLMISMALAGTLLKRLPVSASMLYLAVGYGLGSAGWGLMAPNPRRTTVPPGDVHFLRFLHPFCYRRDDSFR